MSPSAASSRLRIRTVAGACLLALALGAIVAGAIWTWAYHEWVGRFSDSISYLLLADYYNAISVGRYPAGIERFYQTTRFPPLFGYLLAMGGGGTGKVQAAAAVTQVTVVLAAVAMSAYLIRSTRDLLQGALLMVPVAVCTGPFVVALDVVSEPLYACLTYAALATAPNTLRRSITPLLLALAPLARAIGVFAAPAVALWYWRGAPPGRRWRRAALGLLVLGPYLLWMIYRRANPAAESYLTSLDSEALFAPFGGWLGLLASQPYRLFTNFVGLFDYSNGALATTLVAATLAVAVVGGIVRWRRNELDVQFACAYLAPVVIWPYSAELPRLLSVLIPIVVVCAWEGWRTICAQRLLAARAGALAGLLPALLASMLPVVACAETTALVVRRAIATEPVELRPYMRTAGYLLGPDDAWAHGELEIEARVRYAIESLPQYMPPDECVYSISPMRTWVYGRRYSKRMPTEFHADQDARAQFRDCRYLLITFESTRQANEPLYFPLQHVRTITAPVFVSQYQYREHDLTAAVLLRFKD